MIARLASVVLLAACLLAQAPSPRKAPADFRIAGTVVNSLTGEPLGAARVSIVNTADPQFRREAVTTPDGRFVFAELAAAKYSLTAGAQGYTVQGFRQHGNYYTAVAVGPDLDATSLVFRLVPDAVIEGTVNDEDGEPVRNASVMLFQRNNDSGRQRTQQVRNAMTDDRGHYQFAHRPPGTYFVAVSARPWYAQYPSTGEPLPDPADADRVAQERAPFDVAYPLTFYPSAETSSSAAPILLHAGERLTANVSMRAVPAVHLQVRVAEPGDQNLAANFGDFPRVSQRIFEGDVVPVMSAQSYGYNAGLLEYTGIAPGHYIVEMPVSRLKAQGGWYKEMDLSGAVELDARQSPSLVEVTGTLTFEGGSRPGGKVNVILVNRSSGENFAAEVKPDGAFDFTHAELRPATYDVVLNNAPHVLVKDLLARGAQVSGKTVTLSGPSAQLVITAAHSVARVEGVVERDGKPFAGAMVVLVPRNPESDWTLFRRDQSDSDGTFALQEVLPGPYTVIAVEDNWDLDWANSAALQPYLKKGTPIEVSGTGQPGIKVQLQ